MSAPLRASAGLILIPALLPQSGDRFNINSQLEHLQQKYVGTGHADASKLCVAPFRGPRFPVFFQRALEPGNPGAPGSRGGPGLILGGAGAASGR